jgi:hypothetical protein
MQICHATSVTCDTPRGHPIEADIVNRPRSSRWQLEFADNRRQRMFVTKCVNRKLKQVSGKNVDVRLLSQPLFRLSER